VVIRRRSCRRGAGGLRTHCRTDLKTLHARHGGQAAGRRPLQLRCRRGVLGLCGRLGSGVAQGVEDAVDVGLGDDG
jgi:hypothetical protein